MPDKSLVIVGTGSELQHLVDRASSNIEFVGFKQGEELVSLMQEAKAYVFMSREDFGIAPVEAMACGTPVIAYDVGGVKNTVIDGKTGVLFDKQSVESLNDAIEKFETMIFDYKAISDHASKFSTVRFEAEIKAFVDEKWDAFVESDR
ncbi:MAG: glycosyltransferase [Campylobacterota bacterium]|nr:glycosyltransferase [Campylobacterota bacterium]